MKDYQNNIKDYTETVTLAITRARCTGCQLFVSWCLVHMKNSERLWLCVHIRPLTLSPS